MRRPIVQGVGILGLLCGLVRGETFGQAVGTGIPAPNRSPAAPPGYDTPPGYPPTLATSNDDMPPGYGPARMTNLGGLAPTTRFTAYQPGASEPPSPTGSPGPANETDVALPKAERPGGGGEPTTAAEEEIKEEEAKEEGEGKEEEEKEEEAPAKDETKLLMNFLGRADAPVKVYGWIQNSFTGNTRGTPKNGLNFGVNPNFLANRWMGNQYYLIIENPLEQTDRINFGFRVDILFGNDWQFNHMRGLNEHSFRLNHFAGYDPAQIYGEIHLPYLTRGGIDVKGGRFYTILGYEVVPAIGRPLLSVPYMFNYGQPFTHLGVLSTLHLTDRINLYNGTVNGYDRWFNETYKWNYLGGFTYTTKNGKGNLAISYIFGPNQYPRFLQPSPQTVLLPGNTVPPYEAGRRNPGYGSNWRTSFTNVFSYKWTDKLTQVIENDDSFENNIPGSGPDGTNLNDSWYSFGNWFLYAFTEKLTGVWRAEVFRDDGGQRTGFRDNFYEQTLGLIWKPKPYIWIRPEARYDWSQFTHPYIDGTKKSQLTLAVDAILLY